MTEYEVGAILHQLGRVQERQDAAAEAARLRDEKLDCLACHMQENAAAMARVEAATIGLEARVTALEEPVKVALIEREMRGRWLMNIRWIALGVLAVVWAVFEPLWRALVEIKTQLFMGR